jgi:hypothetical protein
MMRMSQEGEWKTKKVSEKNRSYTASATAKRFSSTKSFSVPPLLRTQPGLLAASDYIAAL